MRRILSLYLISLCLVSGPGLGQSKASLIGKTVTLTLLSPISSETADNSPFQARLSKSLVIDQNIVIPEGAVFRGRVRTVHARRLHRSGSIHLVFESVRFPTGTMVSAEPSLVSLRRSDPKASPNTRVDREGTIHPRLSKKRMLLEIGLGVGVAKAADDLSEMLIRSATTGVARYVGWGSGLAFYFIRKGPELKLPQSTKLEVIFARDLTPAQGD